MRRVFLMSLCGLWMEMALFASSEPAAVSPGDATQLVLIGDSCPTFSWAAVDGARSYELVVYELGDEGEEAQPVLTRRISGAALAWTPPLGRCLDRGGSYAWSVRALGDAKASDWSAPSLFRVASGPSEADFEAALRIVKQYVEARQDGGGPAAEGGESATSRLAQDVDAAATAPRPRASPAAGLQVDGVVEATSFSGDGSGLTGVGHITDVVAGNGLVGGGDTGSVALAAGAGPGIALTADNIAVDFAGSGSTSKAARSDHHHATTYVHRAGDTMSGSLTLATPLPRVNLNTLGSSAELRYQKSGSNGWSLGWDGSYLYFYDWQAPGGTRLVIDDATGNVGIGTHTPGAKLDVGDMIRVRGNSAPPGGSGGSLELLYNPATNTGQVGVVDRTAHVLGNLYLSAENIEWKAQTSYVYFPGWALDDRSPVYLPHDAQITKVIAYWRDHSSDDGWITLYRKSPTTVVERLVRIDSSFNESGVRLSYCPGAGGCTIWTAPTIDNRGYYYYLESYDPDGSGTGFRLEGVKIHYTTTGPH